MTRIRHRGRSGALSRGAPHAAVDPARYGRRRRSRRWRRSCRARRAAAAGRRPHGSADAQGRTASRRPPASASAGPTIPVLVLTTFDDDANLFGALRAGAAGYLLKDVSSETLVSAIQAATRGESFLQSTVTGRVVAAFARLMESGGPKAEALVLPLSPREREILALLGTRRRTRRLPIGSASPRAPSRTTSRTSSPSSTSAIAPRRPSAPGSSASFRTL